MKLPDRIWLPKDVLGQRVRQLREQLGLTQGAFGVVLGYAEGVAQSAIAQVERGKSPLPEDKLLRLSRLTHTPLSHFMEEGVYAADATGATQWQGGYFAAVEEMGRAIQDMRRKITAELAVTDAETGADSPNKPHGTLDDLRARRAKQPKGRKDTG